MQEARKILILMIITMALPGLTQAKTIPCPQKYQPLPAYYSQRIPQYMPQYSYLFQRPYHFIRNNIFCCNCSPKWMTRTDFLYALQKYNTPVYALETIQPIFRGKKRIWFWQARISTTDSTPTINFGGGFRHMTCNRQWLLGLNAFYNETLRHTHKTVTVGAEVYTPFVTVRGNYYAPLSGVRFVGNTVEQVTRGFDYSIETPVPYVAWTRFTAGGYNWRAVNNTYMTGHNVNGAVASFRIFPLRQIEINVGYAHDNSKGSQEFINFAYYLGAPAYVQYAAGCHSPCVFAPRCLDGMKLEKVRHDNEIVFEKARNPETPGVIVASGF